MFAKSYLWTIAVLCLTGAQAAVIAGPSRRTSYGRPKPNGLQSNSIEDNLIDTEYDAIHGLLPPESDAKDYYNQSHKVKPLEIPAAPEKYVVDTVNKVIKVKTEDGSQETELQKAEEIEIKKLSAAFRDLLENSKLENYFWDGKAQTQPPKEEKQPSTEDWKKLNPIISVSKSDVSFAFGNDTEEIIEEDIPVPTEENPARDSLWDALAKSVDHVLTRELDGQMNITDETNSTVEEFESFPIEPANAQEEPSRLFKFVSFIQDVVTSSFNYVGTLLSRLMHRDEEVPDSNITDNSTTAASMMTTTTPSPPQSPFPTTTAAVFALEEPTSLHRLPSEEFNKRGRDIDSLLYGYGIA